MSVAENTEAPTPESEETITLAEKSLEELGE